MRFPLCALFMSICDANELPRNVYPHGVVGGEVARQISHRWRPHALTECPEFSTEAISRYAKAQIVLSHPEAFACVGGCLPGIDGDMSLYVMKRASLPMDAQQRSLLCAVLWGPRARRAKTEHLSALVSWYQHTYPDIHLVTHDLHPDDCEAWLSVLAPDEEI